MPYNSDELIKKICEKCRYYRKGCSYDYGDSLTKLPCHALIIIQKMLFDVEGVKHAT